MNKQSMHRGLVLIIEDDSLIRGNLVEILEEEGYSAKGAANGQLALEYLRTTAILPDLVLLDLMMPVMTGWEFRTEQQNDAILQTIPVVIITADGNAQQKAKIIDADGWLRKPIEIDTLLKTIERTKRV